MGNFILETMCIFELKNLIFCQFSEIRKFNNPCDIIKSKLDQKGAKFKYYIPTVIKRLNNNVFFSWLVIHFLDQF